MSISLHVLVVFYSTLDRLEGHCSSSIRVDGGLLGEGVVVVQKDNRVANAVLIVGIDSDV